MVKAKYLVGKLVKQWIEYFYDALILYSGDLHEIEQNIESQLRLLVSFPRVSIVRIEENKFKIYISYRVGEDEGNWESREIEVEDFSWYAYVDRGDKKEEWKKLEKMYDRTRRIRLQDLY